jgi:hypothetical protein
MPAKAGLQAGRLLGGFWIPAFETVGKVDQVLQDHDHTSVARGLLGQWDDDRYRRVPIAPGWLMERNDEQKEGGLPPQGPLQVKGDAVQREIHGRALETAPMKPKQTLAKTQLGKRPLPQSSPSCVLSSRPRLRRGAQSASIMRVGVALSFSATSQRARSRGDSDASSRQDLERMAWTSSGRAPSARRNSAWD